MATKYKKKINGKVEIKEAKNIVVRRNKMQVINPSEELILCDGWEVYEPQVYEPTIDDLKVRKKNEIMEYDSSSEVNEFTINGMQIWLDKATRAGLMLRFQAEKAVGKEYTTLWYGGHQFELAVDAALQMLYSLENYASACYDNTQRHLSVIDNLETKEDVDAYDYSGGYPSKLEF